MLAWASTMLFAAAAAGPAAGDLACCPSHCASVVAKCFAPEPSANGRPPGRGDPSCSATTARRRAFWRRDRGGRRGRRARSQSLRRGGHGRRPARAAAAVQDRRWAAADHGLRAGDRGGRARRCRTTARSRAPLRAQPSRPAASHTGSPSASPSPTASRRRPVDGPGRRGRAPGRVSPRRAAAGCLQRPGQPEPGTRRRHDPLYRDLVCLLRQAQPGVGQPSILTMNQEIVAGQKICAGRRGHAQPGQPDGHAQFSFKGASSLAATGILPGNRRRCHEPGGPLPAGLPRSARPVRDSAPPAGHAARRSSAGPAASVIDGLGRPARAARRPARRPRPR